VLRYYNIILYHFSYESRLIFRDIYTFSLPFFICCPQGSTIFCIGKFIKKKLNLKNLVNPCPTSASGPNVTIHVSFSLIFFSSRRRAAVHCRWLLQGRQRQVLLRGARRREGASISIVYMIRFSSNQPYAPLQRCSVSGCSKSAVGGSDHCTG
jgi:hypothetical protein